MFASHEINTGARGGVGSWVVRRVRSMCVRWMVDGWMVAGSTELSQARPASVRALPQRRRPHEVSSHPSFLPPCLPLFPGRLDHGSPQSTSPGSSSSRQLANRNILSDRAVVPRPACRRPGARADQAPTTRPPAEHKRGDQDRHRPQTPSVRSEGTVRQETAQEGGTDHLGKQISV